MTVAAAGTALLLIDVINDLSFPGSDGLIEQADIMAPRLPPDRHALHRARLAGPPRREAPTPEDNALALRQIENVLKGITAPSSAVTFR